MEYWSLIWGSAIMIATGVILWWPERAAGLLPDWAVGVSEVIHFYEAILACLAVAVWHLYFTIFDPEVYPMNQAWITGKGAHRERK
ncbi:MAG: hypothetical protein ACYTAF_03645 [Planctomycetota bacterium]